MARYIDADKLINKMFPIGLVDNGKYTINAKAVKVAIDQTPTADVVPKRDTYYIEEGKPPVLIETSENRRSKIAREIFEEIEKAHDECIGVDITTRIGYFQQTKFEHKLAELKKKYTEGEEYDNRTKNDASSS